MSPTPEVILLVCILVLDLLTYFQARKGGGLTRRTRRRDEYAARSAAYGEQLGGTGEEKLRHALDCFHTLDLADNKVRNYSDREARIAIEAHLGGKS